jgi:type II secretory ATPase GspE/PulE/Tfp pilus assembly ATPase PilB-like protein
MTATLVRPAQNLPEWASRLDQAGLVGADVIQTALRECGHDAQLAGTWLVEHGCISQRELALTQAESFGLPFVEPGDYRINLENRNVLPEELLRGHRAFPLFVIDRVITLAVAWPLELPVLDQIRLSTGREVDQCLASPRELRNLVEWAFGGFQQRAGSRQGAEAIAWDEILKDVADAPAVKLVHVLLDQAAASDASDIHIDADEHKLRVRFRIDGLLREVPAPPKDLLPAIVSRIKVLANMDIAETRKPQDGHFKFAVERREIDVRVSTLPSANGEAVVLRLLHGGGRLLSLEELGMDPAMRDAFDRLIHLPHGMLLVTGPTGSGKTTTLYSALTRIDRVRQSLITLEDPVEIRLPGMRQVAVNPKAGLTFATGLRAILRQDPDVIMIGEVRDQETAETALQAALTGHLVLSTLHTNSAAGAPGRLLDMRVPDFLVTSALVGVLAQRLCRCLCRNCARPLREANVCWDLLPAGAREALHGASLMEAVGCKRCGHTGYEGRVGIYELLILTDEIRRVVLKRADERTIVNLARENGMRLLSEDGLAKVARGQTTLQELLRVAGRIDAGHGAVPTGGRPDSTTSGGETGTNRVPRRAAGGFDVNLYDQLLRNWLWPGVGPGRAAEN